MDRAITLLPSGARVYVRDPFFFGDACVRGKILVLTFDPDLREVEYLVDFGDGFEQWIHPDSIQGYLYLHSNSKEKDHAAEEMDIQPPFDGR